MKCLNQLILESQADIELVAEEWDILRDASHDLSDLAVQKELPKRICSGQFDVIIISPPCNTWSRVLYANPWGPKPIRSFRHPMGFPWLQGALLQKATAGNTLVLFSVEVLQTLRDIRSPRTLFRPRRLMEHPEDLGGMSTQEGVWVRPASIWQLPAVRALAEDLVGVFTVAVHQCSFGAPYKKPTRFLTDLPTAAEWGFSGWPHFDEEGGYLGPLPKDCGHGGHVTLAKKRSDEAYCTAGTSSYPPALDMAIATAILDDFKILPGTLKPGRLEEVRPAESAVATPVEAGSSASRLLVDRNTAAAKDEQKTQNREGPTNLRRASSDR
jgi:hypothetical protein